MSEPHKWAWVIRGSLGILAQPKPITFLSAPVWRAWWCLLQKPRQPQVRVRRCHPGALQGGCGHKSKCICNIHQYTICLSILVLVYFLVWMIRARFHLQACKGPEVGWNHLWTETLDPSAAAHSSGLYLSFPEKEHVKISQNEFWCLTALLIPGVATWCIFRLSTLLKMTGPRRRRCGDFGSALTHRRFDHLWDWWDW